MSQSRDELESRICDEAIRSRVYVRGFAPN